VDVALDAAAFAAVKTQQGDHRAAVSTSRHDSPPDDLNPAPPFEAHTPEMTWTRHGVVHEQPLTDTPELSAPFESESVIEDGASDGSPDDDSAGTHNPGGAGNDGASDNDANDDEGVALTTLLESLLFVASEPVDARQLAQALDQPLEIIELGLAELADYYQRSLRGLRIQRFNNKVQLVTTPIAAPFIEIFLNLDNSTRLSSPALETLAVIAYRQPVTRAQIEAVRGVDCAGVLRSLVQRGLVVEVGRMESMGRPILYGVTEQFMQHFGLVEMGELPPLEETEADRLWAATVLDEPEFDASQGNPPQG
jgi:segregation and condensation protein B